MGGETGKTRTSYGVCTIDTIYSGRIIDADNGFLNITGYSKDELLKNNITYPSLIVHDVDNEHFRILTENTLSNGMACIEHFMCKKDGTVITVSCFGRNRGNGRIDLMLTEDKKEVHGESGGEYDRLTGLYNYTSAAAEIDRLLKRGISEYHSCILMRLKNIERMDEEYGTAFTGAIIENTAMYINHHYLKKNIKVITGRMSRDTFFVFHCSDSAGRVEEIARWVCDEMRSSYYGRHTGITTGIVTGICHMGIEEKDFRNAMYLAGRALEYADRNNISVEVYNPEEDSKYEEFGVNYVYIESTEQDERIFEYDNRFVSFAVALLANAKDPESSLDVLLQRTAWRNHFNTALVAKFEEGHYVKVLNKYMQGIGIVTEEEVSDMNDWDNFMRSFDGSGFSRIDDTSAEYLSESDRAFFKERNIGSSLNFLLKDGNKPSGYLSLCSAQSNIEWDRETLNTLMQLSKIIGVFLARCIKNEEDEKRFAELSKDFVTGLYTYSVFANEAKKLLKKYDDTKCYALLYTDIDNFSYLNKNYGYEIGDMTLKGIGKYLEGLCAKGGLCGHMQADQFVTLLIRDTREEIEAAVKEAGEDFKTISDRQHPMGRLRTSTGVYYIEKNNCDIANAVDSANRVWKAVKKDRFASYKIYDEKFQKEHETRLEVIGSIQDAIKNGEIIAFLQPKFSMRDWTVVGAEALCRWKKPDGKFRYPDEFIPALEEEGQIVDVDFCIYEQVLKALKRWEADGRKLMPISVNFSRVHVNNEDFSEKIIALAKKYEVDPKYIEVEITESTVSKNNGRMLECMHELREGGFRIDMDDFGTGYSSLNMLIEAPIDIVKIDKSFIDKYENPVYRDYIDRIGGLIVTARKEIIFEGVETSEQLKFLKERGYDNAQGYIFSRPIPMEEFEERYIYAD